MLITPTQLISHFLSMTDQWSAFFSLTIPILLLLVVVLLAWYKFAYAPYQFFKKLGIPHPPVTPFVGNTRQIQKLGALEAYKKWIKEYGKVCGYYIGAFPRFIIADPDLLKEIMVKEFDKFSERRIGSESLFRAARRHIPPDLVTMKAERWKQTRPIITPAFSTRKLKLMIPLVERSCDSLLDKLKEVCKNDCSVDIWRIFGQFTMETILATAFGHQVNILKGEGDEMTKAAGSVFRLFVNHNLLWNSTIISQLPFLIPVSQFIGRRINVASQFTNLIDIAFQLVESRRATLETIKKEDFLQLLLEARAEDIEDLPPSSKKTLSDEEIVSLSIGFILAGYETTSNCLAFTAYLLAINPDKQDILLQAIEDYLQENEDASCYDIAQNVQYLDWVIQESLRMYSPGARTLRCCNETCTIKGITFPKGSNVFIAIQQIHYSPDYWDQPEIFRPERFSPKEKEGRHPLCHLPFGWGPRNCIGMRFALMEAKMALISILKKYKFERAIDTQVPLKTTIGITQVPVDGIFIKIVENSLKS